MIYELPVDSRFDLHLTLSHPQGHRWRADTDRRGAYISFLGHDFVLIEQQGVGQPLRYEASPGDAERIEASLRRQFRLEESQRSIEETHSSLQHDRVLAELVDEYGGLRIMRVDAWECLVFFILSAHNHAQLRWSTAPTAKSMDTIASTFAGRRHAPISQRRNLKLFPFPRPDEVGTKEGLATLEGLWADHALWDPASPKVSVLGGSLDMPRRIHEAALWANEGYLASLAIESGEYHSGEVVAEELKRLRGVGEKTAGAVALFGLGHMDVFPMDVHVLRAILWLYFQRSFADESGYVSQLLFSAGIRGFRDGS